MTKISSPQGNASLLQSARLVAVFGLLLTGCQKPLERKLMFAMEQNATVKRDGLLYDAENNETVNGYVKDSADDGVRILYQVSKGKRNGEFLGWHPNGLKKVEGSFRDGNEHGLWSTWDENGAKLWEGHRKNGTLHGTVTRWHSPKAQATAVAGTGADNAITESDVTLTNFGAYYISDEKIDFLGGGGSGGRATAVVSEGCVISIRLENGGSGYVSAPEVKISSDGWRFNEKDFRREEVRESGFKKSEGTYENGLKEGGGTIWHPNGRVWQQRTFSKGKKEGRWTYFDKQGRLVKEEVYRADELIDAKKLPDFWLGDKDS
ncbi:MAG: hypothetical protein CMI32_03265 [Opitutales bacterium]|nr:hypothetical protein [Opitutales bacterium]